ncbi:MAG: PHP domain-containing protein [Candidatus Cloacimonetes bacterium]|nr:PHP domain-containing protein [Candidatus Cloacimonadota bacterium]
MKKIDLHIHTTFSDGSYTPKQILQTAKEIEFSTISITDHDCVDGYLSAKKLAKKYKIELIPGTEISCYYRDYDIHILAYFINPKNKELKNMLKFLQKGRTERAIKMVEKLNELGIDISMKQLYEESKNKNVISRAHFASVMLKNAQIKKYTDAFYNYIGNNCPAHIRKSTYSPSDVFRIIRQAGGLSVLAHPGIIKNDFVIPELVKLGLDGLEIFYPLHTFYQKDVYLELAKRYDLVITGGSDFHGKTRVDNRLGMMLLKENYLENLKTKWRMEKKSVSPLKKFLSN